MARYRKKPIVVGHRDSFLNRNHSGDPARPAPCRAENQWKRMSLKRGYMSTLDRPAQQRARRFALRRLSCGRRCSARKMSTGARGRILSSY